MSIRYEIKDFDDLDMSDDGTELEVLFTHNRNGNQYVDIPVKMIVELFEKYNENIKLAEIVEQIETGGIMITVEMILKHNPCDDYPEARLRKLIGNGLTLQQVSRKRIPTDDKVWVFTRDGVLSDDVKQKWLDVIVERSIRRSLGKSGSDKWEAWANKWLSGEDRSVAAAGAAAGAAASDSAWSAARSAWAGAWAASDAAWDAAGAASDAAGDAGAAWTGAWATAWAAARDAEVARAAAEKEQQVKDLMDILTVQVRLSSSRWIREEL